MAERMRLHETVLRMREWLLERDVELVPAVARADELYEGAGAAAPLAWQAFRAVADEAAFSQGWPKNPHSPRSHAMPEHFD